MTKYYKDNQNNVFAYSEIQTPKDGLIKITELEALELTNPPPTTEQIAEQVRAERDALLAACDWVAIRANELGEPVPQDWADYRQALRDVPEQTGFPQDIEWPAEPESV